MLTEAASIGLVLRHYVSQGEKIIIFNRDIGKFKTSIKFSKKNLFFKEICAGVLIQYRYSSRGGGYLIVLEQIYEVPFALAIKNILFLHHLLEICYFFLPFESYDNSAIFDLLMFVYHIDENMMTAQFQKLLLFRLFALLGEYPEQMVFHEAFFYGLITCPLKNLSMQFIELPIERLLDMWLINCIRSHPMVDSFKTTRFLDEVRIL